MNDHTYLKGIRKDNFTPVIQFENDIKWSSLYFLWKILITFSRAKAQFYIFYRECNKWYLELDKYIYIYMFPYYGDYVWTYIFQHIIFSMTYWSNLNLFMALSNDLHSGSNKFWGKNFLQNTNASERKHINV